MNSPEQSNTYIEMIRVRPSSRERAARLVNIYDGGQVDRPVVAICGVFVISPTGKPVEWLCEALRTVVALELDMALDAPHEALQAVFDRHCRPDPVPDEVYEKVVGALSRLSRE